MREYCIKGHRLNKENTRISKQGFTVCIQCTKLSNKRFYSKPKNVKKRKEYLREWYKNEDNKEKLRIYHLREYNKIREVIEKAKDKPCIDCNIKYPHYVMDFHHNKGDKSLCVGRSRSLKRTVEEIKKCVVICSNCHRIRTFKNVKRQKI